MKSRLSALNYKILVAMTLTKQPSCSHLFTFPQELKSKFNFGLRKIQHYWKKIRIIYYKVYYILLCYINSDFIGL